MGISKYIIGWNCEEEEEEEEEEEDEIATATAVQRFFLNVFFFSFQPISFCTPLNTSLRD